MRIMIVGAGLVGQYLCGKFSAEGHEVVLVDRDKDKLSRIERDLNIMTVHGSGASARILAEASIARTDLFIAVTDSDEVNLISCIMSRQYEVGTRIARVRNEDFLTPGQASTDEALGIDLIISPDWAMTEEIVQLLQVSAAFDMAEFAGGRVLLLGYQVRADNPHSGLSLMQLKKRPGSHNYVLVAILRQGQTIIPRGADTIQAGDKIYLMVRRDDRTATEQFFAFTSQHPHAVFIIGGGDIGYMVARRLEELDLEVKLVEHSAERCAFLAENLGRTTVLNCDGLEAHDLLEEGIDLADLVICVTDSDSSNILASLLAKHHGTKRCIIRINQHDFVPMLGKLGIDVALSPRLVAANMILRYVRRGEIVSVATILDSDAEAMEFAVPEGAVIADTPLRQLSLPAGSIIGAVRREERIFIPSGETVIRGGDILVVFFARGAAETLETFFTQTH